ncbi:hypothetical protein BH24ACI4_BH24ACI4_12600 [soil metagenome]|nr:hypothetical protein [Acidobacteriota bacterium]
MYSATTAAWGLTPLEDQQLGGLMMSWVQHPRRINPRTAMPDTGVTDEDVRHIAAYLYTLK